MTVTSGRDLVMNRLATEASRWGGLGEERRSLPPSSG